MAYRLEVSVADLTERFVYLDQLRESGRTNMYLAASFLEAELGLGRNEARHTLKAWMATFARDKSPGQRATERLNSGAT